MTGLDRFYANVGNTAYMQTNIEFTDSTGLHVSDAVQGRTHDLDLDPAPARVDGSSLVNHVDTRRGTNSTGGFSRGNNVPAATAATIVPRRRLRRSIGA